MKHRRFGRTELQMPVFSCGGMRYQFFRKDVPGFLISSRSQSNLEAIVHRALDVGLNHFETARGYGTSERQLGRVLAGVPRDRFIIQTKVIPQANPSEFRRIFEKSWQNLGLEQIDLLAIHGINTPELLEHTLKSGGCLEEARKLQREGQVGFIGFSTHAPTALIQHVIDTGEFDFVNLHWYYINQENWPAIAAATQQDMGVFIISPTDKGGHLYNPPQKLVDLCTPLSPMVFNDLFCLSHPQVHTLSIGASCPTDFDEHLKTLPLLDRAETVLPPILEQLEQTAIATFGQQWWQTWHEGLPTPDQTPDQINVPVMLWLRNLLLAYDMESFAKARYNLLGRGGHWFPGNRGDRLSELDLSSCLRESPHRDRIPELLIDTHQRLVGKRQTRLTQTWKLGQWKFWRRQPAPQIAQSETMSRITIVHAWHDDNRGDCALLLGLLTLLYEQWPQAHISLISSFTADDPAFTSAYRHTLDAFPTLEIFPAPFWGYDTHNSSQLDKLQTLLSGMIAGLDLLIPFSAHTPAVHTLKQADMVIAAGGHIQPVSSHPLKSLYLTVRTLYFLLWAKRYGVPYSIFSRSFDLQAIESNSCSKNRIDCQVLRSILANAVTVYPRGDRSLQSLLRLGVPKDKLTPVPDGSFLLSLPSPATIQSLLSTYHLQRGNYWVVTVKQCPPFTEQFLQEMAQLIQQVLQEGRTAQVVIVVQSLGPDALGDDRGPSRQLMMQLEKIGVSSEQVSIIDDDLTPSHLLAVYSAAQWVIGTRLQSIIFALVAGVPAYAIAYCQPKTQDIMTMMGMAHLHSTVESLSATTTLAQIDTVDRDTLKHTISHNVQGFKEQLSAAMQLIASNELLSS